jgi:hypothetical protein
MVDKEVKKTELLYSKKFLNNVMHRGEPIADILDNKIGIKEVLKVTVHKTDNIVTESIVENF